MRSHWIFFFNNLVFLFSFPLSSLIFPFPFLSTSPFFPFIFLSIFLAHLSVPPSFVFFHCFPMMSLYILSELELLNPFPPYPHPYYLCRDEDRCPHCQLCLIQFPNIFNGGSILSPPIWIIFHYNIKKLVKNSWSSAPLNFLYPLKN